MENKLQELAKEYHDTCEAYDQMICSGRTDQGIAMPVGGEQMGKINRHAREVLTRIQAKGKSCGFSADEVMKAIQDYRS